MKLIRHRSVITGGETETLSVIPRFPILVGGTTRDISNDVFEDMVVDICKESGMIQLKNLIPPQILYNEFHSEAFGEVWGGHHDSFSELICRYANGRSVLEIGGAGSRLAIKCVDNCSIKKWTIVDPNITVAPVNDKINYIHDFFSSYTKSECKSDMVVHSHVFEHFYQPALFLSNISDGLNYGDYHIFSVPNLYVYLKRGYVNALTFEHTLLLTEEFIDYLLSWNDFRIEEKIYYGEHSIFYVTKKQKTVGLDMPRRYDEYKNLYVAMFTGYERFITKVNDILNGIDRDVYLFGGHIFSQYLIALGLDIVNIVCILDNSVLKNGKRLYGTDLMIKFPSEVNLGKNSVVILKTGSYTKEIKKQLLEISSDIEIWE